MSRAKKDADAQPTHHEEWIQKYEIFRINLRLMRYTKDISAEAMGKEIGFSKYYRIGDMESARGGPPKLNEVISIAKYFDVTIDKLLFHKAEVKF